MRRVMALRLSMVCRNDWTASMKPVTPVRNCSADLVIIEIGLFVPIMLNRSARPGAVGRAGG